MAAYVTTHDRSVLPKPLEETKVTATQTTTHKDILGKLLYFNQSIMLRPVKVKKLISAFYQFLLVSLNLMIRKYKRKLYLD